MNLNSVLNESIFDESVENLLEKIKVDYAKWTDWEEGIQRFNEGIRIKVGTKYTKVLTNGSVWGFIANKDGVHKGIPHQMGDVFKAAGWAAPAKWVRGSIFDGKTDWFSWTGPNYL